MSGIFPVPRTDKKGNPLCDSGPTTILTQQGKRIKIDKDDDVKVYLRMMDDHKLDLKKTKQGICAFCLSRGYHYDGEKWTQAHFKWIRSLELSDLDRETLNEYLVTYEYQTNRIEGFGKRIEELASETEYVGKVKKLVCFLGVKTHTALSCLVETGDFQRFAKGNSHLSKLLVAASTGICKGAGKVS